MYRKLLTPWGEVEIFNTLNPRMIKVYHPRKWWQINRRPVTDARCVMWCVNYLYATNRSLPNE